MPDKSCTAVAIAPIHADVPTVLQVSPDSPHLSPEPFVSRPIASIPVYSEGTPFHPTQACPAADAVVDHPLPSVSGSNEPTELMNSVELNVFNYVVNLPIVKNLPILA